MDSTTNPTMTGDAATGGNLGSNPGTLPTDTSVSNAVHVTDACNGTPTHTVTHSDSLSGCVTTRTFTITATDACNNHATATVVYTWTSDTGPIVTCPPSITIATNFTPLYCTFTPSDWNSSCNGANTTPSWWVNWDQQNHGYNCIVSWTNWWTACTGKQPWQQLLELLPKPAIWQQQLWLLVGQQLQPQLGADLVRFLEHRQSQ